VVQEITDQILVVLVTLQTQVLLKEMLEQVPEVPMLVVVAVEELAELDQLRLTDLLEELEEMDQVAGLEIVQQEQAVEEELEQALLEVLVLLDLEVVEKDLDIKTQAVQILRQTKMEVQTLEVVEEQVKTSHNLEQLQDH
tara:strand:- start:5 stop:424 length:420 start_codon:yes stop_codon:yes gene_type:complete